MFGLFATTEVRWFSRGIIPDDIQVWFDTLGLPVVQPVRTDVYFPLRRSGIGIKLRQGRLEIKLRRTRRGIQSFSPGVSGHVETWVKGGVRSQAEFRSGLRVEKARQILYYQLTEVGEVLISPSGDLPKQGGGLELTQVWFNGAPWWTVGIEVFGPRHVHTLEAIAGLAFNTADRLEFTPGESASYSSWLVKLHAEEG